MPAIYPSNDDVCLLVALATAFASLHGSDASSYYMCATVRLLRAWIITCTLHIIRRAIQSRRSSTVLHLPLLLFFPIDIGAQCDDERARCTQLNGLQLIDWRLWPIVNYPSQCHLFVMYIISIEVYIGARSSFVRRLKNGKRESEREWKRERDLWEWPFVVSRLLKHTFALRADPGN